MGLKESYFNWMCEIVMPNPNERIQYNYLLSTLHLIMFHFSIPMDENRMQDGIDLRGRFSYENGYFEDIISRELQLFGECTMLEMMVALAIKGGNHILYDYETGGKADIIFESMLESLDLLHMVNDNFDEGYVNYRIAKLLNHDYDYNGKGGLFTVDNPRKDMRLVDIWYQMSWYIQKLYNKK